MGRGCSSAPSQNGRCTESHERRSSSTLSCPVHLIYSFQRQPAPRCSLQQICSSVDAIAGGPCAASPLSPLGTLAGSRWAHRGLDMSVTWWGLPETHSYALTLSLGGDGSVPRGGRVPLATKQAFICWQCSSKANTDSDIVPMSSE